MIRVLIADDSSAIREGLSSLLALHPCFEVVGIATDGLEAVAKARELLPHVVIMDAQMPNMDGLEATRCIKEALPQVAILFLSVFTDYLEASVTAGADSYLAKDCRPDDLFSELQRIGEHHPADG